MVDNLPPSILRAKGILRLTDKPGHWVFQLVGRRHELTPADSAPDGDRLVFLGTPEMPNEAEIQAWLDKV